MPDMIKDWLVSKASELTTAITDAFWSFLYQLALSIYSALVWLMQEMVKLITKFPLINELPELYEVWRMMSYISFACIGLIFIYLAAKKFTSVSGTIIANIEMKLIFGRTIYALIFVACSRVFIDLLIQFNNMLIEIFVGRFDINDALNKIMSDSFASNLVASCLIIYQMYLAIKIMVGYWVRVAEICLIYVASPGMYVLWINPSWGGYLSSWVRRTVTLVFTQFVQVLIMIIYSQIIYRFFMTASISSICLAAACLILMTNTPNWLSVFIAPDNSLSIMTKTWKQVSNKTKSVSKKIKSIKGKGKK